jgi:hypothetical protein
MYKNKSIYKITNANTKSRTEKGKGTRRSTGNWENVVQKDRGLVTANGGGGGGVRRLPSLRRKKRGFHDTFYLRASYSTTGYKQ